MVGQQQHRSHWSPTKRQDAVGLPLYRRQRYPKQSHPFAELSLGPIRRREQRHRKVSTCLDSDGNRFEADVSLIPRFIGMGRRKGGVNFIRYWDERKNICWHRRKIRPEKYTVSVKKKVAHEVILLCFFASHLSFAKKRRSSSSFSFRVSFNEKTTKPWQKTHRSGYS